VLFFALDLVITRYYIFKYFYIIAVFYGLFSYSYWLRFCHCFDRTLFSLTAVDYCYAVVYCGYSAIICVCRAETSAMKPDNRGQYPPPGDLFVILLMK
jgi:hypothetical protein